jgi:excisionase family DNA binding protein
MEAISITPNQLRLILADALERATERDRSGISPAEQTATTHLVDPNGYDDPLPGVTAPTPKAEDVASLLGVSPWSVYASIRSGEIPSLRVGRRIIIPTYRLRAWLSTEPATP